jgi:replicative DNA helicase
MTKNNSQEAEASVLSCIMVNGSSAAELLAGLKAEWFYFPTNKLLFETIEDCLLDNRPCDQISLCKLLNGRVSNEYIIELSEHYISIEEAATQIENLHDYYLGRAYDDIYNQSKQISNISERMEFAASAISELMRDDGRGIVSLKQTTKEAMHRLRDRHENGTVESLPIGESTFLMKRKNMSVLIGSNGTGKTTKAMQYMLEVAKKHPVYYRSIEMGEEETTDRFLANIGTIDLGKFDTADFKGEDWTNLANASKQTVGLSNNLIIDYSSTATVSDIRNKVSQIKLEKGDIGLVVVDYFTAIDDGGDETYKKVAQGLNRIKKDFDCHVLVLAQPNKDVVKHNKKPNRGDIDFGKYLAQDADNVLVLYSNEEYSNQNLVSYHSDKTRGQRPFSTLLDNELRYNRLPVSIKDYKEPEQPAFTGYKGNKG